MADCVAIIAISEFRIYIRSRKHSDFFGGLSARSKSRVCDDRVAKKSQIMSSGSRARKVVDQNIKPVARSISELERVRQLPKGSRCTVRVNLAANLGEQIYSIQ